MARNSFNININLKGFPQAQRTIRKTKDGMDRMRVSTSNLRRVVGALRNNLLLISFAATIAAKTIGKFISAMSGFEDAKVRLQGLMGSVEGAERAFKKFNDVASTTPFELSDVVNAGVTLKAFGADAEDLIKTILDLAASMGMNAVDAANAFGRAYAGGAGAADIFREKGILQIIKDFKGIEDITKLSLPQFRKAMIETLQNPAANIAGATDRMAGTFTGAFSNMSDSVIRLSAVIGDIFIVDIMDSMRGIGFLADSIRTLVERVREGYAEFELIGDSVATFSEKIKVLTVEQLEKKLNKVNRELKSLKIESKGAIKGTIENLNDLVDGEIRITGVLDSNLNSIQKSNDALITINEQYKNNTVGIGNFAIKTGATAIIIDETTKTMQDGTKNAIVFTQEMSNLTMQQAQLSAELKRKKSIDIDLQNIEGVFPELYAKTAQSQMDNIQTTIDLIEKYKDQLGSSKDVAAVLEMLKEKYKSLDPEEQKAIERQEELDKAREKSEDIIKNSIQALDDSIAATRAKISALNGATDSTVAQIQAQRILDDEEVKRINTLKRLNDQLDDIDFAHTEFKNVLNSTTDAQMKHIRKTIELITKYSDQVGTAKEVVAVLKELETAYSDLDPVQVRANQLLDDQIEAMENAAMAAAGMRVDLDDVNDSASEAARAILSLASSLKQMQGDAVDAEEKFAIFLNTVGMLIGMTPEGKTAGALFQAVSMFIAHTGGLVKDKGIQRFATGGTVRGQDNVPIMAQAGEFIMRREAVQNIGVENLAQMNRSGQAGNININISAPLVDETVIDHIIPAIQKAQRMNLA